MNQVYNINLTKMENLLSEAFDQIEILDTQKELEGIKLRRFDYEFNATHPITGAGISIYLTADRSMVFDSMDDSCLDISPDNPGFYEINEAAKVLTELHMYGFTFDIQDWINDPTCRD